MPDERHRGPLIFGPKADWLPLRQAVFKFGVAEDRGAAHHRKPLGEMTEADVAENDYWPFALDELTRILEKESGARKAKIDIAKNIFSFLFNSASGGASCTGGPPWLLLEEPKDTLANSDPRLNAEALFNKEGFTRATLAHEKQVGNFTLSRPTGGYDLLGNQLFENGQLRFTVYRFKGQEAPAIILTDVDPDPDRPDHAERLLFTGMTRATVRLELVLREGNSAAELNAPP